MVREPKTQQTSLQNRGLIVGNYCHDVLIRDGNIVAETLGGAASFISSVLDGMSISFDLIAKVGSDFAYTTNHSPVVIPTCKTTMFHAYYDSEADARVDRVLKRVCACDPITSLDVPDGMYNFGMAVGVGGEILPETLERLVEICDVVFVDVQALLRVFDDVDGTVKLVGFKESRYYHLLPRIGFLKASAEEAGFIDVEEVRKFCCVVVTQGKDGCKLYWKSGEMHIEPFVANQVDPTGAGDSFLGGFVAGLVQGLSVPDAALLANFFGSMTVGHVGLPILDSRLLQIVKDTTQKREMQGAFFQDRRDDQLMFRKPPDHEQFHASLCAAKMASTYHIQESECKPPHFPNSIEQPEKMKLPLNSPHERAVQRAEDSP